MSEVNRKLASIRKIASVEPIEGADNIELVHVDGWQCVTKKGDFSPEDLCVYFEIDSFLPIRPEFEFLRKSSYKKMGDKEGFRLKTIRLRGQLSQGLVMPFDSISELEIASELMYVGEENDPHYLQHKEYCDNQANSPVRYMGQDLSNLLGVIKYDPPIPAQLAGVCKGNFPSFIRKTDQERVQNIWHKIKDSKETFEVTVKLDGTSCTYYLKDGVFGVCSMNLELIETEDNTLWKLARELRIEERLREAIIDQDYSKKIAYSKNIALQGEVVGEGIQGNPRGTKGQHFALFDIWDIDNKKYFKPNDRNSFFNHYFLWRPSNPQNPPLMHVPILEDLSLENFNCLNDLITFADGYKGFPREGLVFKSNDSDLTFKVISNEYLLMEKG